MAATKAKKQTKAPVKKLKVNQKKQTNKWLLVGGVAAVVLIGLAVVRYSGASKLTFLRGVDQFTINGKKAGVVTTGDGTVYSPLTAGPVDTIASQAEIGRSTHICMDVINRTGSKQPVTIAQYQPGVRAALASRQVLIAPKQITRSVCVSRGKGTNSVIGVTGARDTGVMAIYGLSTKL